MSRDICDVDARSLYERLRLMMKKCLGQRQFPSYARTGPPNKAALVAIQLVAEVWRLQLK